LTAARDFQHPPVPVSRGPAPSSLAPWATIIATVSDAILIADDARRVVTFNAAAERMFGCAGADALGRSLEDFLPGVAGDAAPAAAGGARVVSARRPDGTTFDVEAFLSHTVADARTFHTAVLHDAAARRRDVEAHARLAALIASSDDAIVAKDLNGIVTDWNRGAEEIFGYTAAEMVGQSITRILPPERLPEEHHILATLRRGDRIDHFETERVRKDGRRITVSISVSPIRDGSGRVIGAAKIARDVTARTYADEAQARLAALVQSSDDAIVGKDLNGVITDWNGAAERIFGYTRDEVLGRSITILLPPERLAEEAHILATLRRGDRIDHFDTVRIRKDGTPVQVSISVSPIKDSRGRLIGAAKIARDVTARKQLEEEREQLLANERAARAEAEAANRAKDEFLSMVSHELRTPLAAMLGWVGVLRQGKLPAERVARALETIERNGRLQSELIDDLLDMSRIITGRLRLVMEPTRLQPVVQAALDAVRPDALAGGVELDVVLDPGARVVGDALRLQQVASNLLGNAVKFTPRGGRVEVRLESRDGDVRLVVRDTGRGIPAEFLPHVFEPFRQADDVKSRKKGGLGLGLAIVRHLVEQHGGRVEVASPGPDLGATFTVVLPVAPPRQPSPDDGGLPRLDGLRVLVVEDDDDAREGLRAVLEDRGALVTMATSTADARRHLHAFDLDVLVSDIRLPGEDAYELVQELQATERLRRVPAVAVTAYEAEGPERTRAAGFDAHFGKPVDLDALVGAIAALTSRQDDSP
jgi:PAS domain S-box-containing protein